MGNTVVGSWTRTLAVVAVLLLAFLVVAVLALTGRLGDLRYANVPLIHPYPSAAMKIQLSDEAPEIGPVPAGGGGGVAEAQLDRLSNILKTFNEMFGNIQWADADRIRQLVSEEIPGRVAADKAYRNAQANSDKDNARIEHDKALGRVMTSLLKDDTELFKQFSDNESFRKWLLETVFALTYQPPISDTPLRS